jgi:hypothetical protein
MKTVKRTHTYTNHTGNQWQLVGNSETLISTHSELTSAKEALKAICVDSSPWGTISIVAPGQTISGELVHTEWEPTEKEQQQLATQAWLEQWIERSQKGEQ